MTPSQELRHQNVKVCTAEGEYKMYGEKLQLRRAEFGIIFRRVREENKISLRDAAKRIGVSPSFLSDCELGRRHPNEKMRLDFIGILENL